MRVTPSNQLAIPAVNMASPEEMDWCLRMLETFGHEPSSTSIASFHESGHITVSAALGFEFKNAYLARDAKTGLWGGWSAVEDCGIHSPDIDIQSEPIRAFVIGLTIAAGLAGERYSGADEHPCSSLDERLLLKRIAVGISRAQGVEPAVVMAALMDSARFCISINDVFFNTVATTLKLNKRLLKSEYARYTRSLTTVSMVSLLPSWLHVEEAV